MKFSFFLLIPLVLAFYDTFYFFVFLISKIKEDHSSKFENLPELTVIVVAKNEERTIKDSVLSIMNQEYPNYDLIVIDDGSTDSTWKKINNLSNKYSNLKKIRTKGLGKWKCLNIGISKTKNDIVTIDADTILKENALLHIGSKLKNYDLVAGNLRVKRNNFLSKIQATEHLRISMFREYEALFDKVSMVPGAIGGYKREIFNHIQFEDSLTEDFNLFTKAQKKNYSIAYASNAKAVTKMHKTFKELLNQRLRWSIGNLETINIFSKKFTKIILGDILAFLDLLTYLLLILNPIIILFFIYETMMILIINWIEEKSIWLENILYPLTLLILSLIYLSSSIHAYWKIIIGNNTKREW